MVNSVLLNFFGNLSPLCRHCFIFRIHVVWTEFSKYDVDPIEELSKSFYFFLKMSKIPTEDN